MVARLLISTLFACALLLPPRGAGAGDVQIVLPSWASDRPAAPPHRTDKPATPAPAPPAAAGDGKTPASPRASEPPPAAPQPQPEPQLPASRPVMLDEAEATFVALKMFRVNQAAMRLCDRLARRGGADPPRRVRFQVKIDAVGKAGVAVAAETPMTPGVARCYQSLAQRWPYPATGAPYALDVSRISTGAR